MTWGLDTGILAKGAMRHLWKIANRMFIVFAGKFYGEIVFWRKKMFTLYF